MWIIILIGLINITHTFFKYYFVYWVYIFYNVIRCKKYWCHICIYQFGRSPLKIRNIVWLFLWNIKIRPLKSCIILSKRLWSNAFVGCSIAKVASDWIKFSYYLDRSNLENFDATICHVRMPFVCLTDADG